MGKNDDESTEAAYSVAEKRYFAFISYARSDLAVAQFVQRTLEHFRYPRESIRKEYYPDDERYVREIFLDKTGLSGRGLLFDQRLEAALANSRYLIVICSPRAAQKKVDPHERHYVEWEIQTFLKHHGDDATDRIIPIIIEGEPNKKEDSCLPKPLRTDVFTARNLPDMRSRMGTGKSRKNWHSAMVTLLSYVFNVERSIIFDRFAAERAKTRARIVVGVALGALIATALVTWGIVERKLAADQKAERHLVEAIRHLEQANEGGLFTDTGLGLAYLAQAARLPAAHDYLLNQLMQRSWIVPIKMRTANEKERSAFLAKKLDELMGFSLSSSSRRITAPSDFPLVFEVGEGVLTASERTLASKDGRGKEIWRIGEQSAYGFSSLGGKVSPTGRVLVMHHLPSIGHPGHDLVAFNPFTGQRIWSRKSEPNVNICSFSADGNRMALLSTQGRISVLNALTGEREFETYDAGMDAMAVSFADDDNGIQIMMQKNKILECRFVKNLVEFAFKPTGYPIVAHSLSPDGSCITLSMNTGGTCGFADTYDCRTFERLERVDLTNVVARVLQRDAKDVKSCSGRFHAVSSREAPTSVKLFDSKSKSVEGRIVRFPDYVNRLSFVELDGQELLMVLGGPMNGSIKNAAFYAIVVPETGRIIRMRTGLPESLGVVFAVGSNAIILSGASGTECRLTVLPSSSVRIDHEGFKAICNLLSGMVIDELDVPLHHVAATEQLDVAGALGRFVRFAECRAEDRTVSFVSDIPFRRILDNAPKKDDEWRKDVLSVIPGELTALEDGLKGELMRITSENYAYRHPELSRTQVEMHFVRLDLDERTEAMQNDSQARYYADKITKYLLNRHPDAELSKKSRALFDNIFGE